MRTRQERPVRATRLVVALAVAGALLAGCGSGAAVPPVTIDTIDSQHLVTGVRRILVTADDDPDDDREVGDIAPPTPPHRRLFRTCGRTAARVR